MPAAQKSFLCVVSLLVLCAFGGDPDCASDEIKNTVIKIVKDNPPAQMLTKAGQSWYAKQKQEIEKECGKTVTDECHRAASEELAGRQRLMDRAATYNIDNISMTNSNEATGAVSCTADLHVVLPEYWGRGSEPVTYLVEKLQDGHGFNVTLRGLQ